jgi:hypothetical protein
VTYKGRYILPGGIELDFDRPTSAWLTHETGTNRIPIEVAICMMRLAGDRAIALA